MSYKRLIGLLLVAIVLSLSIFSLSYAESYEFYVDANACKSCVSKYGKQACTADAILGHWPEGWYTTIDIPENFKKVTVKRIWSPADFVTYKVNDKVIFTELWRSQCWPVPNHYPDIDITDMVHAGSNTISAHSWRWPECMWDLHSCVAAWFLINVETGEDSCGAAIPSVPFPTRQCDSWWGNLRYDNTSGSICDWGCALSSLNMLMNSKGCYPDFLETNSCASCFSTQGWVNWGTVLNNYCQSVSFLEKKYYGYFKTVESVLAETSINDDIKNGYNYILQVRGSAGHCTHFVFLTGASDDCESFNVIDPGGFTSSGIVDEICGYRKFK